MRLFIHILCTVSVAFRILFFDALIVAVEIAAGTDIVGHAFVRRFGNDVFVVLAGLANVGNGGEFRD